MSCDDETDVHLAAVISSDMQQLACNGLRCSRDIGASLNFPGLKLQFIRNITQFALSALRT